MASAQAAAGCRVTYTVTNQWPTGFGASVNIDNLGDPVNGWRLTWSFGAGQTITQLWSGSVTQSGAAGDRDERQFERQHPDRAA